MKEEDDPLIDEVEDGNDDVLRDVEIDDAKDDSIFGEFKYIYEHPMLDEFKRTCNQI